MIHSLIPPRKKPLLSKFNTFCAIFVATISIMVIIFAIVLRYNGYLIANEKIVSEHELTRLQIANRALSERLATREKDVKLCKNITSSNEILRQSIKNLFDLVPDSIVLSEVLMEQKSLLIKGTTPTKEIFNTLLKTPLVSIFASSKTSFYQQKSGWYNFTSINTIENAEVFDE